MLGEAMACGVPAVSFDCPSGPRELIRDGVDGLLIPPNHVDGLADGIERLISDQNLMHDLSSRAPEIVHRYALSKVLEQWDALFAEVSDRAPGPVRRS